MSGLYGAEHSKCNNVTKLGFKGLICYAFPFCRMPAGVVCKLSNRQWRCREEMDPSTVGFAW